MSHIHSLVYAPDKSEHQPPYHYNRVPVERINLIAGHGIEGDFKAGRHPARHLNVMTHETLLELAAEGFKTGPGEMGEQIVVSGVDVGSLSPGDRLRFGADAVIEVTEARTGCSWFEQIQSKSPQDAAGRMGVMAKVIQSGEVRAGDTVTVLETVGD